MTDLKHFHFWCQKVLPLVYDDSLSYYEVLCRVTKYINELIDSDKEIIENADQLRRELATVQKWIADFDPTVTDAIIEKYLVPGIYVTINPAGYFTINRPAAWRNIHFGTTGYDMNMPCQCEYGHLVLMY